MSFGRNRDRELEAFLARLRISSVDDRSHFLGQVVDGGAIPTGAEKYFLFQPVSIGGTEEEGAVAGFVDTGDPVPVVVLGSAPSVGDRLVASLAGNRWVASRTGVTTYVQISTLWPSGAGSITVHLETVAVEIYEPGGALIASGTTDASGIFAYNITSTVVNARIVLTAPRFTTHNQSGYTLTPGAFTHIYPNSGATIADVFSPDSSHAMINPLGWPISKTLYLSDSGVATGSLVYGTDPTSSQKGWYNDVARRVLACGGCSAASSVKVFHRLVTCNLTTRPKTCFLTASCVATSSCSANSAIYGDSVLVDLGTPSMPTYTDWTPVGGVFSYEFHQIVGSPPPAFGAYCGEDYAITVTE